MLTHNTPVLTAPVQAGQEHIPPTRGYIVGRVTGRMDERCEHWIELPKPRPAIDGLGRYMVRLGNGGEARVVLYHGDELTEMTG